MEPIEHYKNTSPKDIVEIIDGIEVREEWRDISGYEGIYMVSNFGRVKSLERLDCMGRRRKGLVLVQNLNPINKYIEIGLMKNGIHYNHKPHRLVGIAFIENPKNKPEVNHKKGIRIDNRLSQLEWATKRENEDNAISRGCRRTPKMKTRGMNHYKHMLVLNTESGIFYGSIGEASRVFNIQRSTLRDRIYGISKIKTSLIFV